MLKDEACWRYLETEIEDPTEETGRLSDRCFGSQHILKRISNCWGSMDFPYVRCLQDHFTFLFEALRERPSSQSPLKARRPPPISPSAQ
jgi:hypothetical protein